MTNVNLASTAHWAASSSMYAWYVARGALAQPIGSARPGSTTQPGWCRQRRRGHSPH
ncbi:hypothetical protein PF005_g30639 [Phytophthora fragariae]|uniref:Uncharacterized protein n=2 Tax=Phytophthora TaxID=4783 RepID=A0A6A3XS96_9STRA|nr:hypothetical protein PF003_g25519 [Phytophthora fragariae]KAE9038455.1 hypothetical protein PR002_g6019 [Phytophthora rubi]KAE8902982.1 hypothetical protein PF003_g13003 [Phytophthora fragariae]KAE8929151.1 hypothetical protein PF009_g20721 [Phytophthora fragariae]KAE8960565.1 hypothetical protein PF011_g30048 [Phytophthora fragariae]